MKRLAELEVAQHSVRETVSSGTPSVSSIMTVRRR